MTTHSKFALLVLLLPSLALGQVYFDQIDAGNIDLTGNTVSTTNTNGDLSITPNGTGKLLYTPATASTVPYFDSSKKLTSSAVTPTELGYVSGVTSSLCGINQSCTITNKTISGASNTLTNIPAANLTGTVPAASLPNPSATTLGGIESAAAVSHQWINSISTLGVPALSQPAFSDVSGNMALSQLPTALTWPSTGIVDTTTLVANISGKSFAQTLGPSAGNTYDLGASASFDFRNLYLHSVANIGVAGSSTGSIALSGSNSGTITIQPQAAAGTYNFNFPTTAGTSGQVLTSGGGAGVAMTWSTPLTNPMTTTGDIIYSSNNSGSAARLGIGSSAQILTVASGLPAWTSLKAITKQVFTSGSGTYTQPAGVLYIKVFLVGGGGGGANSGTNSGTATSAGTASCFGTNSGDACTSPTVTGGGGTGGTTGGIGGPGGSASIATSTTVLQLFAATGGGGGSAANNLAASWQVGGGTGGTTCISGGGAGGAGSGGTTGVVGGSNTGAGGGGGLGNENGQSIASSGAGGGGGGCASAVITDAGSVQYYYKVGASGNGGSGNGTSGYSGGNGGSGIVIIEEHYQ